LNRYKTLTVYRTHIQRSLSLIFSWWPTFEAHVASLLKPNETSGGARHLKVCMLEMYPFSLAGELFLGVYAHIAEHTVKKQV